MPLRSCGAYNRLVLFRIRRPRSGEDDFAAGEVPGAAAASAVPSEADMTNPDIRMAGANANALPDPIPFRDLKGQASAYDARAERLVLGIRAEVEELRDAVAVRQQVEESVMRVDAAALMAQPGLVGAVPPMLLARLIDDMRAQVGQLEDALSQRTRDFERLQADYADLQRDHAGALSRLDTLQDVIAALHANLQDLRAARDYERESALRDSAPMRALPPVDA